ncbi:MAG: prolyl oligopeptidase family serine peptidase [Candidatus Woesearchaeota archaeon]|nr:prolyl oligopeptidase family serine peptidase [Candidatus Woesearchaeota archaeon]
MEESFAVLNEAGLTIRGTILRPKPRGKFPLVAIANGFFGIAASPVTKETSRLLLEAGFAVAVFDFTNGFGKSEGRASDITMSQRARDISDVITYAKRRAYINEKKTYILGYGYGAMSALILEAFHPIAHKLVLVNTPSTIQGASFMQFDSREMMRIKLKRYFHVHNGEKEELINYTFFEDGEKIDMPRCARNLRTPTLFIAGEKDEVVSKEQSQWFVDRVPAEHEFLVLPGEHITGKKGVKAVVDAAVTFLK